MSDQYYTISGPATGEFKDKGSKFIAFAFPASTPDICQQQLEWVKKEHPKARHHCFAWRLGTDGNAYRFNDDGEPSGTAGRPILSQIDKANLTDINIIVVRYFGGTLLGTSGLITAYRTSAFNAIENAAMIQKTALISWRIEFDYAIMDRVMLAIKKTGAIIISQQMDDTGKVILRIPRSEKESWLLQFKAWVARVSIEEAEALHVIPGIDIQRFVE